ASTRAIVVGLSCEPATLSYERRHLTFDPLPSTGSLFLRGDPHTSTLLPYVVGCGCSGVGMWEAKRFI
ncbi:hypothetical protein Pcinc_031422, partial [Petrolisthes cinctipes]